MALENKLGLILPVRKNESARKRRLSFLKTVYSISWRQESFLRSRQSTNISLTRFTTLPEKSEP